MKSTTARIPKSVVVIFVAVCTIAIVSFAVFRTLRGSDSVPAAASTPTSAATQPAYPFAGPTVTPTPVPTLPFLVVPTVDLRSFQMPTPVPLPTYTPVPFHSPTPQPSPTQIQPITAWLPYTNTTNGYRIAYPNTWYLEVTDASNVFITSYKPPSFRGTGNVKIDLLVTTQNFSETLPTQTAICIDSICGLRVENRGPFISPASGGINRVIGLRFQIGAKRYIISAAIQDPQSDADRNAAVVEQIIFTFHFIH